MFICHRNKWSPENYYLAVGNGQSNGAGGPGDSQQQPGGEPPWREFVQGIDGMGDRLASSLRTELGGRLDALRNDMNTRLDRQPEPPPEDPNANFDFDTATNRQMYDHMMGQFEQMSHSIVQSVLAEVLEPFTQEISGLRGDFTRDKGTREITQLQGEFKDYNEWVPEMKQIASQHPSLSLREVYQHAKFSNGEKAKTLEAKYNPPPPPPPRPFSLSPSTNTSSDRPGQPGNARRFANTNDGKQEALRASFEEVNARHGGVLGSLEDAFPTVTW